MENFFRFSDYEIFAYLAAGIAALVAWDYVFSTHWVIGADWNAANAVTVVFAAYVSGHIAAWPAAWLIERRVVRCVLGAPSRVLFGEPPPGRCHRIKQILFPDYYTPLDRKLAQRVQSRAEAEGHRDAQGEDLFWAAFARTKGDIEARARMSQFLKLYGFCRNMAFLGVAAAVGITVAAMWRAQTTGFNPELRSHLLWACVALAAGVSMFYRYLKFHRLYTVEVFVSYASSDAILERSRK